MTLSGLEPDWTIYKSAKNSYNIGKAHHLPILSTEDKLQSDTGDPTKMWKTINELMNNTKKDTKISELRTHDNEPLDLTQIPNAFNKYFIELGDELCNDIPPSVTITDYFVNVECPANTLLYFKEISETQILRLLHGLSASKASGMDQISAGILKIASHIYCTLTYINFPSINSYGHISN